MESNRRLAVKVGALVVAGVLVGFLVVVILGAQRFWFHEKITVRSAFPDVAGLKEGAEVRLGGREVGVVTGVAFSDDPDPARAMVVSMRVRKDRVQRLRRDSKANISTQGLLGDKLIALSIGSPEYPPIEENGGWVEGIPPADPSKLLSTATEAAEKARSILTRVDDVTKKMEGEAVGGLQDTLMRVNRIVARVEQGPGTLHDLIFGSEISRASQDTMAKLGGAAASFDRMVSAIKLDGSAPDLLVNASNAARNVADAAGALDRQAINDTMRDVREIVAHVKAGRGSLGGFIMDPTLYEETKRVLVNIRRNRVLKTIARYVISKDTPDAIMDGRPDTVVVHPRSLPTRQAKTPTTRKSR